MSAHTGELDSRGDRRLIAGLCVSIAVHVLAFALLVATPSMSRAGQPILEHPSASPQSADTQVQLGHPDSSATSITWIGYDEYKAQYATQESEIDQAQFSPAPSINRMPLPAMAPAPAQQVTEVHSAAESSASTSHQQTVELPASESKPSPSVLEELLDRFAAAIKPIDANALEADVPAEVAGAKSELSKGSSEAQSSPDAAQSQAAAAQSASAGDPGDQANKESDAAARLVATEAQLGKPLVGKGLEILTVRPRFTHYTTLTARPLNPLIRIEFGADGKVSDAKYLFSTGVRDVDRPLLDAVFQWSAKGPQLKRLEGGIDGQTLALEIRIILR